MVKYPETIARSDAAELELNIKTFGLAKVEFGPHMTSHRERASLNALVLKWKHRWKLVLAFSENKLTRTSLQFDVADYLIFGGA